MNSRKTQIAIIAIFLIFTFGLTIAFFALPKQTVSQSERRPLAQTPAFTLKSFLSGELSENLEGASGGYIPDHFPFRTFFVGVNSYFNLALGNTASNNYYNSKDGYIITKPPSDIRTTQNIGEVNTVAASFDEVTLMVVPSTGYILSDLLPINSISYPDSKTYSLFDSMLSENVNAINLTNTFREAHTQGNQIYYKTDHHWTTEGAYIAYTALCKELKLTPISKDKLTVSAYNNFYGTTYSSSGYYLNKPDTLELWENKAIDNCIKVTIDEGNYKKATYSSMYFRDFLNLQDDKVHDMYSVFLNNSVYPTVTVENTEADSDKTLVIAKDSFAHSIVPFLANHYSKIIMVDLRYYGYDPSVADIVKEEKADLLLIYGMEDFCTDSNFDRLYYSY